MNFSKIITGVIVALLFATCISRAAEPATAPSSAEPLPWLDSLDDAYKKAQREQRPIILVFGATWCQPCHALHDEMAKPAARDKLVNWTRVYIDVDKAAGVADAMGVRALPALRVITPRGEVAASSEGLMTADELVKWLDESGQTPATPAGDEFVGNAPPDAAALTKLLDALTGSAPAFHEAAVKRLLPHAKLAAGPVVELFVKGTLAQRLAALDLLQEWHAPVSGIDPWHPSSLSEERIAALRAWAQSPPTITTQPSTAPAAATQPQSTGDLRDEFAALLAAPTDASAAIVRERLARRGESIRPELELRLRAAATDRDRERLTALRLRLVSTDRLALSWPTGLERLASTEASVRRGAISELAPRATAEDAPLLLELFSSPDALVRETSLRLLKATGGGGSESLTKLLSDPEPNVRAAVLKQFADSPDAGVVPALVKFVASERDEDLIVHAVRVLRATKGKAAEECLMTLMRHESWRVRAEAVEALHEIAKPVKYGSMNASSNLVSAMRALLDDPDGYVVSRAVIGLLDTGDSSLIKPVFESASKRPEMLPDIIAALAKSSLATSAMPELQRLAADGNATVASAALRGLASAMAEANVNPEVAQVIIAGMSHASRDVRQAAAGALLAAAAKQRPQNGYVNRSTWLGLKNERVQVDPDEWLADWRAGKDRPKWFADAAPALKQMLGSDDAEERVTAALALTVLGDIDRSFEVLKTEASQHPALVRQVSGALGWLPWEQRLTLFKSLLEVGPGNDAIQMIVHELVNPPHPRAAEALWSLVAPPSASPDIAEAVFEALRQVYLGERYYDVSQMTPSKQKQVVDESRARAASGSDIQRLVALALLLTVSPDDAAEVAATIVNDLTASEWARLDAFQVQLLSLPRVRAEKLAAEALASSNASQRKVAAPYLAGGSEAIRHAHGAIYLYNSRGESSVYMSGNGQVIAVAAPEGLTVEMIKPLLTDADEELSAHAGYLLAVLGDRSGLDVLIKRWREHAKERQWTMELYRAIAALNDDTLTPILAEVYQSFDKSNQYEIRQFYWTIRSMKGTEILKLRKRIRDEVGMNQLQ